MEQFITEMKEYKKVLETTLKPQLKFVNDLPNNIVDSLKNYTVDSEDINFYLRGEKKKVSDNVLNDIKNIELAFENVPPIKSSIDVYRGQTIKYMDTKAFTSTSTSIKQAINFMEDRDCCFFCITITPGTKVLPLEFLSKNAGEFELLIEKDGYFELNTIETMTIGKGPDKQTYECNYITYLPPKVISADSPAELKNAIKAMEKEIKEEHTGYILEKIDEEIEFQNSIRDEDDPPINLKQEFDSILKYVYESLHDRIKLPPLTPDYAKKLKTEYKDTRKVSFEMRKRKK